MSIWVPPRVARELVEERMRFIADVDRQTSGEFDNDMRRRYEAELKQIDPLLRLVKARPQATDSALRPGFWHIIRDNPGAPPTVIVVDDPETGEYREPSAAMFQRLAEGDLWNKRNMERIRGARRRAEAAAQRERERARERRMQEFTERVDAATRTQVSMNRDMAWSQNVSGRRGARQ